ncbi:MAG: lipoprotein-releasing ABC transporter permease subunit [Proteobacteria bacterium]|nr:lipoprotein-releasing ABC transporter permease subunit [Pseudomonadota bacterium]
MTDLPYEWQIGWRYTRAGRAGRRNGFISFISLMSVIGIALGVAALIIVLSVMNGFQKDVRDRMLAAIAHIQVSERSGAALPDWQAVAAAAGQDPAVRAAAPYVEAQTLVARGDLMRGTVLRGISPADEPAVTDMAAQLKKDGTLDQLTPGGWRIVLGRELALALGATQVGDQVTVMAPGGQMTPAGTVPQLKTFTVAGIFSVGHFEYDSALALIHLDDAARLLRTGGATGVQLRIADVHAAREVGQRLALALGPEVVVRDWTRANPVWYDAVQIEKRMMGIILTLIVAVAAFNLVTTLVMTVTDKRADIAILRTLGASPRSITAIFIVQGAMAGFIGTLAGTALGLAVAYNIDVIVPFIERLLHTSFLPSSIYVISHMPSQPLASDIVPIVLISLTLALLATIYPSWRASRINPVEALRHE